MRSCARAECNATHMPRNVCKLTHFFHSDDILALPRFRTARCRTKSRTFYSRVFSFKEKKINFYLCKSSRYLNSLTRAAGNEFVAALKILLIIFPLLFTWRNLFSYLSVRDSFVFLIWRRFVRDCNTRRGRQGARMGKMLQERACIHGSHNHRNDNDALLAIRLSLSHWYIRIENNVFSLVCETCFAILQRVFVVESKNYRNF